MTAEIPVDERKVFVDNEENKIKQEVRQVQSFDPINVFNMLAQWKQRIEQVDNFEKEFDVILHKQMENYEKEQRAQLDQAKYERDACQKGLDIFEPAFQEWKEKHSQEYLDMVKRIEEMKKKFQKEAHKQVDARVE